MALLFQSNPDRWDIRLHLEPGETVKWFVSRYKSLMQPGRLVLFWSAQGSQPPSVRGLYGWGISSGNLFKDKEERLRLPVRYIERWVHKMNSKPDSPQESQIAPISAESVLSLPSWSCHLLAVSPSGGNFVVNREQMSELVGLVKKRFPTSQLHIASRIEGTIDANRFNPVTLKG